MVASTAPKKAVKMVQKRAVSKAHSKADSTVVTMA